MKIFGMGGLELVIILVVVLIIFGPKNLPKIGNALGKTVSNLREGMNSGKKKKDVAADDDAPAGGSVAKSAEALPAGEAGDDTSAPVVIEADVEEVTFPDDQVSEDDADSAGADGASNVIDDVTSDVEQMFDEAAAAHDAPKRVVKRVVRKKTTEE